MTTFGKKFARRVRGVVKRTISQAEKKFVTYNDILSTAGGDWDSGDFLAKSLALIPVGDDQYTREGRHVRITGILVKLRIQPQVVTNTGQALYWGIDLMHDHRDSGDAVGRTFFDEPNYKERVQKVLYQGKYLYQPKADGDVAPGYREVKKFIKLSRPIVYDTQTNSEPVKGNIVVWMKCEGAADLTAFLTEDKFKVYFSEV